MACEPVEETDYIASIGKSTIVVTLTFWPETVEELVSDQKKLLEVSPIEWFSVKDFKEVLKEIRTVSSDRLHT